MESLGLYIASLFLISSVCQWLAWRSHLPAILYLLVTGFLIGPITGVFDPDEVFGDFLLPIVSLGVAIILFEGSLTLRFREIKNVTRIIRNLCSIGVLITWLGMSGAAKIFTSLGWAESFLFGAMVSVTGPTVIAPMLRSMQPTSRIANVLRWEGILVDPLGAMIGLMVLLILESQAYANPALELLMAIGLGTGVGVAGGYFLTAMLRHHWVPEYLINLVALSVVLTSFVFSNHLIHESGLIAVTVMGVVAANQKGIDVEDLQHFKEHLSVIIISMLFLTLSARIKIDALAAIAGGGILVLLCAQFIVRPLSVWVSAIGTSVNFQEKMLLSWIAPRGIVAAAISAVFAERLAHHGFTAGADALVPLTFFIIIGTVVIQSATGKMLAQKLELSDANSQGVLIVGVNRLGILVAKALKEQGIKVLMVGENWESVRQARMQDISVYYGNPLSESAEINLDLSGLKTLISISSNADYNRLICMHYRPVFEPRDMFMIAAFEKDDDKIAEKHKFPFMFEKGISWQKVSSLVSKGWQIRKTRISENYSEYIHRENTDNQAILLGAITPKGKLVFSSWNSPLEIGNDYVCLFLMPPKDHLVINAIKQLEKAERVAKVARAEEKANKKAKEHESSLSSPPNTDSIKGPDDTEEDGNN